MDRKWDEKWLLMFLPFMILHFTFRSYRVLASVIDGPA